MPGPWRLVIAGGLEYLKLCFNLNRDARPLATGGHTSRQDASSSFNLNRDARPLATLMCACLCLARICFNLNRDARPLATSQDIRSREALYLFQFQPRCQAPCDSLPIRTALVP